ncbi:META domain-containing protein [Litoribaculum gwangyangense]|uniref:META domain-containing protein n=1 Tax=Litoribaculum gwangyangense TaxID=1130722 RepID=A0ABP9CQW2_9FLAO
MKNIALLMFSLLTLVSCSMMKNKTSVIWISGFKTTCDLGVGKSSCLLVSRTETLDNAKWELFGAEIQGFDFKLGQLQKVQLEEMKLEESEQLADAPSIGYRVLKVLDSLQDPRLQLNTRWILGTIEGEKLNDSIQVPVLQIDLSEMIFGGNGGCNAFSGKILQLGLQEIQMSKSASTLMLCPEKNYEDQYFNLLNKVSSFKVIEGELQLFDKDNNVILGFMSQQQTSNRDRLHDIWAAVRVEGFPINRMVTVPQLEVNTHEMKIFGNDGCNEYFGSISELSNEKIVIENTGSTRKMCPEMEYPQRYMKALKDINRYEFKDNILIFYNLEGKEILAYRKVD